MKQLKAKAMILGTIATSLFLSAPSWAEDKKVDEKSAVESKVTEEQAKKLEEQNKDLKVQKHEEKKASHKMKHDAKLEKKDEKKEAVAPVTPAAEVSPTPAK